MSIRLHELNCVEVKERGLGSMRAAAAASGRSLMVSLHPALPLIPVLFVSLAICISAFPLFVFFLSFLLCCPASLSLAHLLSLVTLLIQSTSMNLSSLQRTDDLSSVSIPLPYLSVCFSSILPLRPAC